jgi:hypothetical protein
VFLRDCITIDSEHRQHVRESPRAIAQSPGVAFSAALWLIAFSQGTKIIAVGQIPLNSPDLGLDLGLGALKAGSGKTAKNFFCEAAAPTTAQDIPAYDGRPGCLQTIN